MRRILWSLAALPLASMLVVAQRGGVFTGSREHPAIRYGSATLTDAVSSLARDVAEGRTALTFDPDHGYLRSVLTALHVPVESQTVLFSQTSKQGELISPKNPRALYFNDAVAVGWVRGADMLELSAIDPVAGAVFYLLEQKPAQRPVFTRETDECLLCHQTWDTSGVPGWVTMSVFSVPAETDKYSYASGTFADHRLTFNERWGGWFVTGQLGNLRHLGNDTNLARPVPRVAPSGHSLASLEGQFDLRGFLTPHSDVAALMVLEHQGTALNLMTRLGWQARVTPDAAAVRDAAVELVDYLLFVDEAPLPVPVTGSSDFARRFGELGPRDSKGRSLRQLDLKTRLLRYPCSYLVYSTAFDRLPASAKSAVYDRLWAILSGAERGDPYGRLSRDDRVAIVEILRETLTDLPPAFRQGTVR